MNTILMGNVEQFGMTAMVNSFCQRACEGAIFIAHLDDTVDPSWIVGLSDYVPIASSHPSVFREFLVHLASLETGEVNRQFDIAAGAVKPFRHSDELSTSFIDTAAMQFADCEPLLAVRLAMGERGACPFDYDRAVKSLIAYWDSRDLV